MAHVAGAGRARRRHGPPPGPSVSEPSTEGTAPPLGWGVVGPGAIARVFARSIVRYGTGRLERVTGRSPERSAAFCDALGGAPAADLDELLTDDAVQAVYVATPHSEHAAAVRAALDAGRAVLCEKPLSTCPRTTEELFGLAAARQGLLVEGWMYRHHPQWSALLEHVGAGTVGAPRRIRSAFGFVAPADPSHRLRDPALGGGALLDVGGYPLSVALGIAGAAAGRRFRPPNQLRAVEIVEGPRGVDIHAHAELSFPRGLEAELAVSIEEDLGMVVEVEGEAGRLWLEQPFLPEGRRDGLVGRLHVAPDGVEPFVEELSAAVDCFASEARLLAWLVDRGLHQPPFPLVDVEESLAIAHLLHAWRDGGG